jgi:hypothetical protein
MRLTRRYPVCHPDDFGAHGERQPADLIHLVPVQGCAVLCVVPNLPPRIRRFPANTAR